jgi:DHA2 family multidrug resistance protein
LALSIGLYYSTQQLDLQISFRSASMLRLAQVFGLGFLFVPINLTSYVGMPIEKSSSVAGLVNFMRNIGSSVGTSMVTTLIARRAQFHQVYLVAHVTAGRPSFAGATAALAARLVASGMDAERAARQAYGLVYRTVIVQASTLAYIDTYRILAIGAAIMFVVSFALKKNQPGGRPVVMD